MNSCALICDSILSSIHDDGSMKVELTVTVS